MPNVSSFGAQTDNAVVSGTVTDRQMIIPEVPPQGLMSVGPRVTPNFIKDPWSKLRSYNFFDAVKDSAGSSYIAIKPVVPINTELTDEEFWFKWSDPDAKFDELQEIVKTYNDRISQNASAITAEVARATAAEATKAPVNHANEETVYGVGNAVNYGHLKLASDNTPMTSDANAGIAATPKMVGEIADNQAFDKQNQHNTYGDNYYAKGFTQTAKKTYGRYQNATGASVITNSTEDSPRPKILGNDIEFIASKYPNRDSCALYVENNTIDPIITYEASQVAYKSNSVTINTGILPEEIKIGMFCDAYTELSVNKNKWFVGVVESISGNTINTTWYEQRDDGTVKKATPTSSCKLSINLTTKFWCQNTNYFGSESVPFIMHEYGFFGNDDELSPHTTMLGLYAMQGKVNKGLEFKGHINEAINFTEQSSSNNALVFDGSAVTKEGMFKNLIVKYVVIDSATTVNITNEIVIVAITENATINFAESNNTVGNIKIVSNRSSGNIKVNNVTLATSTFGIFIYDGSNWIKL